MIEININTKQFKEQIKNISQDKYNKANRAVHLAGFFLQTEVKDSIAGHRAEPRSVDTGRFLNSVAVDVKKEMESSVYTDVEYADHLEYGTSRMQARRHFNNSAERNEKDIQRSISNALK